MVSPFFEHPPPLVGWVDTYTLPKTTDVFRFMIGTEKQTLVGQLDDQFFDYSIIVVTKFINRTLPRNS